MSDFDANPFADPEAANPFSDPAVQQAARTGGQGQGGIDEYNPFASGNQTKTAQQANPQQPQQPWKPPPPQPAVMQPTESPPPYTPSAAQKADTAELQRRQEELERKAEELQRKEQQMRDAQINTRANNWPPLPEKCCVGPCFYQDFNVDIPLEFQRIVKILYYLWMFHVCVLFLNILGGLAYFIADSGSSSGGTTFGLAILYFVLFTPCSFVCWYRPVYKAFRSDSSFNFFLFFFIFFFQFCVHLIQCLGINGWGTCGFLSSFAMLAKKTDAGYVVGAMLILLGVAWALLAAADLFCLLMVHRIYRSTGASFAKAQQEFAQGVMKNEGVQNAAGNMAAGAARNAFTGTGSGGNRY
ncbi:secretory carrier-associated membrane protein 1-like isoform X2 [Lineus longissimus]|uniref:secretory carrier-associated membrane protein 1-like isoform X2 n=1 Tax=Lineus longissimus TaxID=88925 RepID=UPI002B4EC62B